MPEYLAPGVYVEEVNTGSKPIEGVSTSTTGLIGVTERGPVNVPILVTSYGEFVRWFGDRLNIRDFSNGDSDRHCYLPHAVQGFFDNGGKRLYLTRILDKVSAMNASSFQFGRASAGSPASLVLRSASELTGSAANPPALMVLNGSGLVDKTWVRVGDGSRSEYHQVDGAPAADSSLVPLHFPFNRSINSGVTINAFAIAPTGGVIQLTADSEAGTDTISVRGANADVTALAAASLVRIGGANGEFRFIIAPAPVPTPVQGSSDLQVKLHLDSPLAQLHLNHADVQHIDLSGGPAGSGIVDTAYTAGDPLLFLISPRDASFESAGNVAVTVPAAGGQPEARRVGALRLFSLAGSAAAAYPTGTRVEQVNLADDGWKLAIASAANDTAITLNDASGLVPGQILLVGAPGPGQDQSMVRSIDATTNGVTFFTSLANAHAVGETALPAPKGLSAKAAAGAPFLALNNRMGLQGGMVLRIADGVNEELLSVVSLPGRAGTPTAPDAGTVQISPPLTHAYASGAQVFLHSTPAVGTAQSSYTILAAPAGADQILVADGSNYAQNDIIRLTPPGGPVVFQTISNDPTQPAAIPAPVVVNLDTALLGNQPAGSLIVGRDPLFAVQALDAGAWGNRLLISVDDEETGLVANTTLTQNGPSTRIKLASNAGVEAGTILNVVNPNSMEVVGGPIKVERLDRSTGNITLAGAGLDADQQAAIALVAPKALILRSQEFRLTVYYRRQPDPAMPTRNETFIDSEVFRYLSMDNRHSRYFQTIIGDIGGPPRPSDRRPEGESWYIRVHDLAQDLAEPARSIALESVRLGPETLVDILPDGRLRPARHALAGGDDLIATLTDDIYIGDDNPTPENRTGLQTLRNIDQISLVGCPGRTSVKMQSALINHCELLRYRFAALDGPQPPNDMLTDVQTLRQQYDTKYASIYHPWLIIPDPFPANLANVADYPIPPSGHVLGLIARIDIERGVHKPPANEVLRGITGLQRLVNKEQQDILNPFPNNINIIRDFRPNNRGIRVFGARVITSDPDWKYVNVRRLLIFIEASIDLGLQWVVFEPNSEPLWARVRRSVSAFLTTVWLNGALEGTKPEEAYFVKCDRTTMTQADIDNGRLIVLVGVAPVKPAEFVIIRIGLWTAQAED